MANCRLYFMSCLTLAASAPAWGQTSTPLDAGRVDRQQPTIPTSPRSEPTALPGAATRVEAQDDTAPEIRTIQFVGTQVPEIVGRAAEPWIGKPASPANLKALTDAMSEAYGRSDVALFTIVVPRQDLSSGNLQVMVAEGYIQSVQLTGEVEGRKLKLVKAYADRLGRERPSSRRTMERYLSLIRDIPGLKVTPQMEFGKGPGAVRLVLKLDYEKPRITTSFDNRTSRLVDGGEFEVRALAFGSFREGDRTEATGSASVNFKDQLYLGLSHSTPIGTDGGRLGLSYGHLETQPSGTKIRGRADAMGLTYSYPVIRGYKRNLTTTLSLDGINSDNTAFGSTIASERTRALRGAIGYALVGKRRTMSGGLTVSKGLDILGAQVGAGGSKKSFFKINARGAYNHAIGKRGAVRLNLSGQWTQDPLPAVERFSIGDDPFGRAFEKGLINADRGVAGSTEVAFRPLRKGAMTESEVYVFVDYAKLDFQSRPGFTGIDLDMGSAGGGVRLGYKQNAMLGLEVANTIDKPYPAYDSEWRFSVTWRLSLKP